MHLRGADNHSLAVGEHVCAGAGACVCVCLCVCVCVCRSEDRGVLCNKSCRTSSGAQGFNNSVLVSALLVQGQGTEISLQSSLFVAI